MARETGRFFRAEYEDVAERDRFMAKWMAAHGQIRGHDAEKAAKEAFLLAKDAGSILAATIRIWHKCEVPTGSGNVRCSG